MDFDFHCKERHGNMQEVCNHRTGLGGWEGAYLVFKSHTNSASHWADDDVTWRTGSAMATLSILTMCGMRFVRCQAH